MKIKWLDAIDIGLRESSPVKPVFKTGFSVVGGTYPDSLDGCKRSIDNLIQTTMKCCTVSEKEAVKLLNNT